MRAMNGQISLHVRRHNISHNIDEPGRQNCSDCAYTLTEMGSTGRIGLYILLSRLELFKS